MTQIPTIGRVVHYQLSEKDAESINKRREDTERHLEEHREASTGVQVHVGFPVTVGEVLPAVIVKARDGDECDLRVLLNGTDTLWSPSAAHGEGQGCWSWPPRN